MTTSVKVHVNGRYRATVIQTTASGQKLDPVIVDGNYEGTSNPGGEHTFWLHHPASSTFEITEEYLDEITAASAANAAANKAARGDQS